jgi:hypothetical protein
VATGYTRYALDALGIVLGLLPMALLIAFSFT